MLYDQALLAPLYAKYGGSNGDAWLGSVCEGTLTFVDRELSLPDGGFLCALDADVDHREGAGHVWNTAAARDSLVAGGLSADDARFVLGALGLDRAPNFRDPHHPEDPPAWVIRLSDPSAAIDPRVRRGLAVLHHTRQSWQQPIRDDKVLLCWNALMICAFAECGSLLQRAAYTERAAVALRWTFEHMRPNGRWHRCWRQGRASNCVALEDLAALMLACVATADATGDAGWFARAAEVYADARSLFFSDDLARWSDAQAGDPLLYIRPSSRHDGAVPSGISMMLGAMTALVRHSADEQLTIDLQRSARAVVPTMNRTPLALAYALPLIEGWSTLIPDAFTLTPAQKQVAAARSRSRLGIEAWVVGNRLRIMIPAGLEVRAPDQASGGLRVVRADGTPVSFRVNAVARSDEDGGWLQGTVDVVCADLQGSTRMALHISACGGGVCHPEETIDLAACSEG